MKQICLARALFFTGICIISSFVSSKGGAAWKIEVFSVFSFVPFVSKQIHHCYLQGRKRSERLVGEGGLCSQMVQVKGRKSI